MKVKVFSACRRHRRRFNLWCFACNRIGAPPSLREIRRALGITEARHVPGQLRLFEVSP